MKVILTNDDGEDAPGLQALYEKLADAGRIIVAAPDGPRSGVGHQVTTPSPLAVRELARGRYSINGTPADCARIALKVLAPDADWLIAGINPGANLGSDVYNSGTVAAAREAAILGFRSIAISQYVARALSIDWDVTAYHAGHVLKMLLDRPLAKGRYWNVNLPHPLKFESELENVFCSRDTGPHNYVYRREGGTYHYEGAIHERPRQPGRDVDVCFGGKMAITLLKI
ncbi:MAG: 5'/3'-nucleotidase SurE [Desulfobacterales bacterium]|nr:5'/3'-nucleotidase SurE [Desulfobacterales bacterium]